MNKSKTKVFLLSTINPTEADTHWASPYYALKIAFEKHSCESCELVWSPDDADLIIICPRLNNPVFPLEIFRSRITLKHRKKCIVLSTDDGPTITHKGFYTSISASSNKSNLLKGGFYPLVAFRDPTNSFPLDIEFDFLFSFIGSFDTHHIRKELGLLSRGLWSIADSIQPKIGFLIKNTSRLQEELVQTSNGQEKFVNDYLFSLKKSKFILCPRGRSPSSVRVFETMKAARVPVIISDEWVPPPEIPWGAFAVFVKERDVEKIPEILKSEEVTFIERAVAARKAWDEFLSAEVLPITITRWGMALLEESHLSSPYSHVIQLMGQAFTWRFIRRGIVSEIKRTLIV